VGVSAKTEPDQILDKIRINVLSHKPIALGARLKGVATIHTLGFKPMFQDYSIEEQRLIIEADKIHYPTAFYADLFNAMGKPTFPSFHTYKFAMDKIKQTAIFNMLGIPHPKTRIFYGEKQKKTIPDYFPFPFVAKKARGSAKGKGVFLINNSKELLAYLKDHSPAYIQEYLPNDRDMRIIIIGKRIRLAFWRISISGSFKTNLSQGGIVCFDPLPKQALDLASMTALKCGWDDVGIDIMMHNDLPYVLEGNMKYGTRGFHTAGINYKEMLASLILKGEI
jgi:ribosomal protein S6--L-glutamate ligase